MDVLAGLVLSWRSARAEAGMEDIVEALDWDSRGDAEEWVDMRSLQGELGKLRGDENSEGAWRVKDDSRWDLSWVMLPLLMQGRTRRGADQDDDDDVSDNVLGSSREVNIWEFHGDLGWWEKLGYPSHRWYVKPGEWLPLSRESRHAYVAVEA